MSGLNDLYPVLNDSGEAIIISPPSAPLAGWSAGLVFAAGASGAAKGLQVRVGGGVGFNGNNSSTAQVGVPHGLGVAPDWVDVFPALTNAGTAWGATLYQYAPADQTQFYVAGISTAVPGSNPTALYNFAAGFIYYFNWIAAKLLF